MPQWRKNISFTQQIALDWEGTRNLSNRNPVRYVWPAVIQ